MNYEKFYETKLLSQLKIQNFLLRLLIQMKTIYLSRINFPRNMLL